MNTTDPKPTDTVAPVIEKTIQDYEQFAFNKNMMAVAIGLIMATAFQKTVSGISDYLIMPIVNYFLNGSNGNWRQLVVHPVDGMNIELGHMIGVFLDFVILTLVLFAIWKIVVKRIWPDAQVTVPGAPPAPTPVPPVPTPVGGDVLGITIVIEESIGKQEIHLKKNKRGHWKVQE